MNLRITARPARPLGRAVLAWALLQASPAIASAGPRGVQLLTAGPGSTRFVVDVPPLALGTFGGDSTLQVIRLPGYGLDGRPGEPGLPVRVVTVAVPPSGDVDVVGIGSGGEWRDGVRLAPLGWSGLDPAPTGGDRSVSARPAPPSSASRATLGPVARLLEVTWMRDQRVARVAIQPASFDPASGRVEVQRRVEVEVRFVAGVEEAPFATGLAPRADGFERIYREALVNAEQGKPWRRPPSPTRGRLGSAVSPAARAGAITAATDTIGFAGRSWVKITIPQTGFYRVRFGQVRNSSLFGGSDTTRLDSLRLFTWPGVPVLPEDSYCDSCGYREVAIGFLDDGDGRFDNNDNDYFYFYALGASDWTDLYVGPQDSPQPDTVFLDHPYEAKNYYYLTIADDGHPVPGPPKRIDASQTGALVDTVGAVTPATFTARLHSEQDREFRPDASPVLGFNPGGSYRKRPEFWEKWFWTSISAPGSFSASVDLPGLEPALPSRLRFRVWGLSRISTGDKSPGVFDHYLDVRFGDVTFPRDPYGWNLVAPQTFDSTVGGLSETGNLLTADVPPPAAVEDSLPERRVDRTGIAWFDVFYPRHFRPVGNALAFDSDRSGGKYVYDVGPFTAPADSMPWIFDVTDPFAPAQIMVPDSQYTLHPDGWHLRFNRVESGRRRYRVIRQYPEGFVNPPNSDVVDAAVSSFADLRSGAGADYLVIYYDPFAAAAESLRVWRGERLPGLTPPYEAAKVPVSAVYDQFSGGRTDPGAIRNFLRAAYFNWTKRPTFVTLLGDASSDFKNLTGAAPAGQPGALVPSYEGGFDLALQRQYATDDWMLNVNDAIRVVPDFLGGRIPAPDAATALSYVRDKLLFYERGAARGEWRDRVMLVGDDNMVNGSPDGIYWGHMKQTVALDVEAMPPEVDRAYVYLHTYPDGQNHTKPLAKADVIHNLNQGVVMMNYIGHGSPFKLADESVFDAATDVGLLTNREFPTVLVAASCDVGKYNDPKLSSLGENLLFARNGGAVAVVSATEEATSDQNAQLNLDMYEKLFERDPITGQFEATLAEGLAVAKTGATNSQKYQVMGDAAVRLILPRLFVETTLRDTDGNPVSAIARGQTLVLRGQVTDRPGGAPQSFDGLAHLLIEDSAPIDTVPNCFDACFGYPFRASPIFRGDVSVSGGQFESRFVVPMNAVTGLRGRARAYVEVGGGVAATDAVGQAAFPLNNGTAPAGDETGPRIALSFVGGATRVRPNAVLRVDLFDDSGILITGNVPQNGIIVTVDENSAQRFDVTSSFRYAANSYQSGAAFFQLPGLPAGPHRVRVSAADNLAAGINAAAHRNSALLDFEVTEQPTLQVTRAILFPNPVRSGGPAGGGQFVIDAPGDSVNVVLKLYTVAGRLIRTLRSDGGRAQVQIRWDGLDAEGAALAKGVYLFKAQVFPRLGDGASGGGQKADADGRFVVIGR